MEHISNFQNLSWRRKALALALTGLLAVTGVASWAAVTDTLVQTNNFYEASIDLTGNGEQTLTIDWAPVIDGSPYSQNYPILLENTGTAQLRYAITSTAVFTPSASNGWQSVRMAVYANADCSGSASTALVSGGQNLGMVAIGSPTTGQQAGDRTISAGGTDQLCLKAMTFNGLPFEGSGGGNDEAVQTLTFHAEATGL